jgi:hypothetical protein
MPGRTLDQKDEGELWRTPDLAGAMVYAERGRSIALGKWHAVKDSDGEVTVYFVPDETGTPRKALVGIEMLRDKTRFDHVA